MKTLKLILALVVSVIVLSSCSKDEDQPAPIGPEISYPVSNFNINFHESGNSDLPTLKWNGEVGSISIASSIPGLEVNSSNGVISWQENLPLGITEFTVVATNSVGQKTVTLQISNEFMGEFEGGINNNPASTTLTTSGLNFDYHDDGTLGFSYLTVTGSGTWSRDGDTITTHFSMDGSPAVITMKGDLVPGYNPFISGFYYLGYSTTPGTEVGYFKIKMN